MFRTIFQLSGEISMSRLFLILAVVAIVIMVFLYLYKVIKGRSTPNLATWLTWLVIGTINLFFFNEINHNDLLISLTPFISTGGIFLIFIYSLSFRKLAKFSKFDIISLAVAVIAIFLWLFGKPILANLSLQTIYFYSFLPTIWALVTNKAKESYLPWISGFIAFGFLTAGILAEWQTGDWPKLVYPSIQLVGFIGVIIAIFYQQQKKINLS